MKKYIALGALVLSIMSRSAFAQMQENTSMNQMKQTNSKMECMQKMQEMKEMNCMQHMKMGEDKMSMKNNMYRKNKMMYGMGNKYAMMKMHYITSTITLALTWVLMFLGIAVLWDILKKNKKNKK